MLGRVTSPIRGEPLSLLLLIFSCLGTFTTVLPALIAVEFLDYRMGPVVVAAATLLAAEWFLLHALWRPIPGPIAAARAHEEREAAEARDSAMFEALERGESVDLREKSALGQAIASLLMALVGLGLLGASFLPFRELGAARSYREDVRVTVAVFGLALGAFGASAALLARAAARARGGFVADRDGVRRRGKPAESTTPWASIERIRYEDGPMRLRIDRPDRVPLTLTVDSPNHKAATRILGKYVSGFAGEAL